jgi:pimeloyl-ACP methyl ester carboxylesterase
MNCEPVRFSTPKGYLLNGLWFCVPRSKQAIIFVHGLGGTMFWPSLVYKMAGQGSSLLAFNNRGHDKISKVLRQAGKSGKMKRIWAGAAHEIFTDCADDIQGAVDFCRSRGFKKIILVGHSTGCQKSVYYLARAKGRQVAKVVLLCPVSDYAEPAANNAAALKKATPVACRLVRQGRGHELLPTDVWPHLDDAQRFLSLYTPDSKEEIFSYFTPSRRSATLQKVAVPQLVVFAEHDEYFDRPIGSVIDWFKGALAGKQYTVKVIKNAKHNFSGREQAVLHSIKDFIRS